MPKTMRAKGLTAPRKATPRHAVKLAPEGIVTAIVAVTGVVDAVADLIVPGAFAHTLTVRRPKVVDDHEWKNKVGRVLHVEEWMPGDSRLPKRTKDGRPWPKEAGALVATMQYNLNAERGREAYEWVRFYAESDEAEFSIGYRVPDGKARKRRDGVRVILMVDLFEFSHVLFGAAPLSMALDVKSMHGGSGGQVTAPAITGADDDEDDYDDAHVDPRQPWDDDEDDAKKKRAGVESKTAASVLLEAKDGGWDRNRGNAENLRRWYREGADGQIPWGSPGDFDACVAVASKHMSPEDAKGYCNLRHHEVTHMWTAEHAQLEGKSADTKEAKAMGRMKGSYEERTAAIAAAAQDVLEVSIPDLVAVCPVATYDNEAIVTAYPNNDEPRSYLFPYTQDPDSGDVELAEGMPVELSLVAEPRESGIAQEADEDVEDVTVVGPMIERLKLATALANAEGKAADAMRSRLARMFATEGKSADEDLPGEVEADENTITADNLPDGDWQEYRKTQPIQAMRMDGPFTVQTREGVVASDGGYLAKDSDGYPYPIADDEFENVYEKAAPEDPDHDQGQEPDGDADDPLDDGQDPAEGYEGLDDEDSPADGPEDDTEDPDADGDAESDTDDDGDGETVTIDPSEHFATMDGLDTDEDGDTTEPDDDEDD